MRYPEEKIRAALLSPDPLRRVMAVEYYTYSYSRDPSIMPLVIEAVEQFGKDQTADMLIWAHRLAQSEATIDWAVREVIAGSPGESGNFHDLVSRFLLQVDPRLLLSRRSDFPAHLALFRSRLARRLELLDRNSEELWVGLTQRCAEAADDPDGGDEFDSRHADDVVDVLACREGSESFALDTLARRLGEEDSGDWWLMPYAARLAGKLRLAAAIPHLVEKLHLDSDYLDAQCETALVRIGTPEVVEAIAAAWPRATDAFQHYSAFVLGHIHSDRAVEVLSELASRRPERTMRCILAEALLDQFATEGIEVAREVLSHGDLNFLLRSLLQSTLEAAQFMEADPLVIAALEQEIAREAKADEARRKELSKYLHGDLLFAMEKLSGRAVPRSELRRADPPSSRPRPHDPLVAPVERVVHTTPRIGRNDRCPCGSGKKYKVCCMRKQG